MSKVRVYELARDLNIETKMLVARIKGMGIDIASHQSSLSDDQVEKVKAELKSGGAASTTASAAPTVTKGPTTVIRRRRVAEPTPEPTPASAEAAPDQEPSKEATEPTAAPEKPSVAASAEPAPTAPDGAKPSETEDRTPEARPAGARSTYEPRPQERRPSGGATIVRRATPEELEAQREAQRAQERKKTISKRPAIVEEDKGLRSFRMNDDFARGTAPSSAPFADKGAPGEEWRDLTRKEKKKPGELDEPVRKVVPKQKRAQMSTRALLNSLEDTGGDEEETPVVDTAAAEAEKARRTVYMPTASNRRRDLKRRKDLKKTQITTPRAAYRVVKMGAEITVGELGRQLGVKASELIKKLMAQGVMATINQGVDFDTATLIASEYGFEVQSNLVNVEDVLKKSKAYQGDFEKTTRPPIVTIMGHVDHGKTSILDAIRQSKVAEGEAGGITQHIGAYTVEADGKTIAFLDTPGHEAFSAMRSRGAEVTDIVVLVVAADDGVMPQTKEAISHAKAANVPIIVAVNKMDKPNINLDRVYTELMEQGIQAEDWGGETQFVKVSALQRTGIDELLEAINLLAEILDLKASPDAPMEGAVVEAHLDKGRGPVATIMVKNGTLHAGDYVVAGTVTGRVRFMTDHRGVRLEAAGPSTPVEVIGLEAVPMAGDKVNYVGDERMAKELVSVREQQATGRSKSSAATLEQLLARAQESEILEVPLVLKADTQGSLEAIAESLLKLNTPKVKNKIVHKAVGGVTESDISLAKTTGAVIIAFNVRAGRGLDEEADKAGVTVTYYSVIYDIVNAVKSLMAGKLPPILTEVVQGHAEVRQTIRVPKIGLVAGTAVVDGKITRNSMLRLIRDNVVIYNGKVSSLRRFKDDVKEVVQGYECGIGIEGYQDIREGDVIESYVIHEEAPTL